MAALAAWITAGCNLAPPYTRAPVATPPAFKELSPEQLKETDGWKLAEPKEGVVRGKWWEMFDDPELNTLEERATVANQNVAVALANFLAARALVKQARSQYFPTVSADPSATTGHQPTVNAPVNGPATSAGSSKAGTYKTFSLPFDASWEPDLWGAIRNTVKAAKYEAQASAADLANMRLTVQAEVAVDYFDLRGQDAQKKILDSTLAAYRDSLNLTQARFHTGIDSDEDVAQAETQLTTAQAQDTDLGILRAQYEHAIATLAGQPASGFSLPVIPFEAKPVAVPFGLPSALLERRPDVAAAERRMAEQNAQIGVAKAAFYPTLTLTGTAGFESTSLSTLANGPAFFWSLGASLAQTIFDGGKRLGATEQARTVYAASVGTYRQTVLTAFQQVEDNLAVLRILSKELREQDAAVKSSARYLALATNRYKLGIDSYLNVITAQATLLSNQRTAATLQTEQITATVQLIEALGGGWDAKQLPPDKKRDAKSAANQK
jgi:NodT family efflux transporter outer membrane factor (OMF) lipoprotein